MARKASPARIKTHQVYSAGELASALGVHRQTILRWVKEKGLKADTQQKPWLFEGRDVKEFLGQRKKTARCKTALNHCFCLGCKQAREPDGKIADYIQMTPTTGMLTGLCPACGCLMNKVVRRADLEAIRARIDVTIQKADARLVSSSDASLNVTISEEPESHGKTQYK